MTKKKTNGKEYWAERARQDKIKVIKTAEQGVDNLKRILKTNLDNVQKQIKEFYDKYGENPAEKMTHSEFKKYKENLSKKAKKYPNDETLQKIAKQDIPKYKIDRLRALETDLQILLTEATAGQETGIYKTLNDVGKVAQATLAKRFADSLGLEFNTIASRKMKQLLSSDWSGASWSERLWKDRKDVGEKLTKILEKGIPQGTSLQKMTRELKQVTGQSFNNAFRLIRTETSHIDGQVTLEGYKQAGAELGLEYYEYDAFLDNKTSTICRELDKKRFKIDDAEVGVNYPPMHPNCRSTTQLVLDEDYKPQDEKVVNDIKENKEEQDVKDEIVKDFKENNAGDRLKEFVEENKEIDDFIQKAKSKQQKLEEDWEYADKKYKEYNRKWLLEQDKEAEKQAALWYEKGKELYIKKREFPEDVAKDLINSLNKDTNNIKVRTVSRLKELGEELETQINKIINKNLAPSKIIDLFDTDVGRSFFDPDTNTLNIAEDVITGNKTHKLLHEAMHWLEHHDKNVLNKSVAFLEYRTKGEEVKKLKDLTGLNYREGEIAKKDNFFNPYCGKIYKFGGEYYATEILSKGLEEIYTNPLEFYDRDKEYFNFVIGVLKGQL